MPRSHQPVSAMSSMTRNNRRNSAVSAVSASTTRPRGQSTQSTDRTYANFEEFFARPRLVTPRPALVNDASRHRAKYGVHPDDPLPLPPGRTLVSHEVHGPRQKRDMTRKKETDQQFYARQAAYKRARSASEQKKFEATAANQRAAEKRMREYQRAAGMPVGKREEEEKRRRREDERWARMGVKPQQQQQMPKEKKGGRGKTQHKEQGCCVVM